MTAEFTREEYDALRAELATTAAERIDAGGEPEAVLWDVVGDVVPRLTQQVCDAILDHSEHDPLDGLVDEVATARDSDDDERRRAEAITVLLQDVDRRLVNDGVEHAGIA